VDLVEAEEGELGTQSVIQSPEDSPGPMMDTEANRVIIRVAKWPGVETIVERTVHQ